MRHRQTLRAAQRAVRRHPDVSNNGHSRARHVAVESDSVPTVRDVPGPYRFFFYSLDCREPRHVHVRRERMVCKFWLAPVSLARNAGFPSHELTVVRSYIEDYLPLILEAWDEHCG